MQKPVPGSPAAGTPADDAPQAPHNTADNRLDNPLDNPLGDASDSSMQPKARRRRASVVGVLGEVLITAGVLVGLFLGWQLWWNDQIVAGAQRSAASDLTQAWAQPSKAPPSSTPSPSPSADATIPPAAPAFSGKVVVADAPDNLDDFGVLYIPRFATYEPNYSRVITEGVDHQAVLNAGSIGHYPDTQMPGAVGNFVVAAHRSAYGGGMHWITDFQLGDAIYVETADGWYTYRFRDLEFVQPDQIDVKSPVPRMPDSTPTDRIITLTSCNPLLSTDERVIAYGVFESFQPRSAGAPTEIAATVAQAGK